jgi:hypothetical protein
VVGIEETACLRASPPAVYVRRMDFQVHTPSGTDDYTGDARYDVEHPGGGLLTVWSGNGRKVVYGPAGWHRVEELTLVRDEEQRSRPDGTDVVDSLPTRPSRPRATGGGPAGA